MEDEENIRWSIKNWIVIDVKSERGGLNKSMLKNLGYTESMIKKIPTLFNKNGRENSI
jgi:hypothetical protein